jgi:nicotinamidase/pyrazinamidase
MTFTVGKSEALLIVDVQRDFLPGGNLAVPEGDAVVPILNRYIGLAQRKGLPVIASRDWHPGKHCSFRDQGGIWPEHCVRETPGAAFAPGLALPAGTEVVSKATREEADAYSAFDGTDLADQLRARGIERLLIGGLATDYCVLNTVLDALKSGFEVLLLEDAIRAVDVKPGDGARAKDEMRRAGAVGITYDKLA